MRTSAVLKAIKGTAGIILAVFVVFNDAHALDACPPGSYDTWTTNCDPFSYTCGVPKGNVYSSPSAAKLDMDSAFPTGNFCGSYGGQFYAWSVSIDTINGGSTEQNYQKACTNSGNQIPGGGTGYTVGFTISRTCNGNPVKQCPSGVSNAFNGNQSTKPLSNVCYNGCQNGLTLSGGPSPGIAVEIGLNIGSNNSWHGSYQTTGAACSGSTTNVSPGPSGTLITPTTAIQIDPKSRCGTVNGEAVCVGTIPAGTCIKNASTGTGICVTSGAATQAPTPPGPDNGTAGQPAAPIGWVQIFKDGSTQTTLFFSSTTMSSSTVGAPTGSTTNPSGTGAPGQTQPGATCGGPGQPACTQESNCGVAGKPSCNVKVDETGTPSTAPDLYGKLTGKYDPDAAAKSIRDVAADSPGKNESGSALASLTGLMNVSADCPALTFAWKGATYNLMTPDACTAFAGFRAVFGVILLVGVSILLLHRAIEVM